MKKCSLILMVAILGLLAANPASHAEEKPIQLALVAPVQLFSEDTPITGVRFNLLYGKNTSVTGLDLGLVNHTTSGVSKGLQWGLVSLNDGDFMGWQDSFVNSTRGTVEGLQWGFVNYAGHCEGLQLGIVNYAQTMHGLQIGLVNVIRSGGQFPVFPIINWSF